MTSENNFRLPSRVERYLAVLNRLYEQKSESLLREIIVNGVVSIHEGWDYDNYNGGTDGHAITFTVPEEIYFKVVEKNSKKIRQRITSDINELDNSQNEHVSEVFIEMEPTDSERWREQSGVYRPRTATSLISSDALQRIWGQGHVRIFLSHKSSIKEQTSKLKQSFSQCGMSAFVAHEDIEPTEEWQHEIDRALFSMDALIALLSPDFHDSNWTDQEVGVAMGRGVPLITIRLGIDPYGLMGKSQGLGGCSLANTDNIALKVFQILLKRLPDRSQLFECALSAYTASGSFADSASKISNLLSVFDSLTPEQVQRVYEAYLINGQNKSSFNGIDLLLPLMEKWTGQKWDVKDNVLIPLKNVLEDEIPF